MKKMMMGLGFLVLSIAVSTTVWAGTFDQYYDYENGEGTYSYYFTDGSPDQGIFVTMDKNWYQNTRVEIEDGGATFYHKDSYNAFAGEGLKGGRLFTIGACVNSDFRNLPSFEYIGFDENSCMNYYAELPTDYQAYTQDEDIRAEYDFLWSGVRDVIAGIRIKGGVESFLTGGVSMIPETEAMEAGEHRILLTGDTYVFTDCPAKAKAGDQVTVTTVDVADGEVKIEVNGSDSGEWLKWGTYTFTMPDEDVEVKGWISTEGYPGA